MDSSLKAFGFKVNVTDLYFSPKPNNSSALIFVSSTPSDPQPLVVEVDFPLHYIDIVRVIVAIDKNSVTDQQEWSESTDPRITKQLQEARDQFRFDAKDADKNLAATCQSVCHVVDMKPPGCDSRKNPGSIDFDCNGDRYRLLLPLSALSLSICLE